MTKSELMLFAHAEARKIVAKQHCSYREAMVFGLRRAYNKQMHLAMQAVPQAEKVNFMWLRGF